jgi:hypothetical protein
MNKSSRHFDFDAEQMLERKESSSQETWWTLGTVTEL